jgi:hypothetical protein
VVLLAGTLGESLVVKMDKGVFVAMCALGRVKRKPMMAGLWPEPASHNFSVRGTWGVRERATQRFSFFRPEVLT